MQAAPFSCVRLDTRAEWLATTPHKLLQVSTTCQPTLLLGDRRPVLGKFPKCGQRQSLVTFGWGGSH